MGDGNRLHHGLTVLGVELQPGSSAVMAGKPLVGLGQLGKGTIPLPLPLFAACNGISRLAQRRP